MSREATMLQWRREVRWLRLSLVRPAAPNTYGGSTGCPCQSMPAAITHDRGPETPPCLRLAVQSEQADLGERISDAITPAARVAKLGVGSSGGPPSQRLFR